MSRYPSATWKPIGGTSRIAVRKDIFCLHTAVGSGTSTWNYFNRADVGVYSHIVVCGVWGADAGKDVDGLALQMADTDCRAAANLDGNWRIVSVETADNAARPIQPWTPAQCETLSRLMADANRLDGIPLEPIPDSRPGRRGIAYHRLGCNPYRVNGGELWSSSTGKDCPTQARIDQIPGLIDRARAIVAGQEDDDVTDEQMQQIKDWIHEEVQFGVQAVLKGGSNSRIKGLPSGEQTALAGTEQRLGAKLDALAPQQQPPTQA